MKQINLAVSGDAQLWILRAMRQYRFHLRVPDEWNGNFDGRTIAAICKSWIEEIDEYERWFAIRKAAERVVGHKEDSVDMVAEPDLSSEAIEQLRKALGVAE
jgi:hypothetical protein